MDTGFVSGRGEAAGSEQSCSQSQQTHATSSNGIWPGAGWIFSPSRLPSGSHRSRIWPGSSQDPVALPPGLQVSLSSRSDGNTVSVPWAVGSSFERFPSSDALLFLLLF